MLIDALKLGEKIVAGEQIATFTGEVGEGALGVEEVQHVDIDITVAVKFDEVGEGHHVKRIAGCLLVVAGRGRRRRRRWAAAANAAGSVDGRSRSRERHGVVGGGGGWDSVELSEL